jgi:hypothetical protein
MGALESFHPSMKEKDLAFVRAAVKRRLVKEPVLRKRIEMIHVDAPQKEAILARLAHDFDLLPNKA